MSGGGTHLVKMGWQIRSSGKQISFQWNAVLLPVERKKTNVQKLAINYNYCLSSPSTGSFFGFQWKRKWLPFDSNAPPNFNKTPPKSEGTHYVPVVVLGRDLCTNSSCSRNGRDTKSHVFIKQRGAPHFSILVYKDTVFM